MADKMTNVKAINYVLNLEGIVLPADVKEKLKNMKASFIKKSGAERKPTATQKENEGLKVNILDYLATVGAVTVTDIMKNVPTLVNLSNQRVSALVRQLKEEGLVSRSEVNRKAYFALVVEEEEEVEDTEIDTETEVEGE